MVDELQPELLGKAAIGNKGCSTSCRCARNALCLLGVWFRMSASEVLAKNSQPLGKQHGTSLTCSGGGGVGSAGATSSQMECA